MDVVATNAALIRAPESAYLALADTLRALEPHPLNADVGRATVLSHPTFWCALGLLSKTPTVIKLMQYLCSGVAPPAASCVAVARVATRHLRVGTSSASGVSPTASQSLMLLLRWCLKHVAQHGRGSACAELAHAIVCEASRHLSLDIERSRPALKLLREGLRLENQPKSPRSGLCFLEPLRRLLLLELSHDATSNALAAGGHRVGCGWVADAGQAAAPPPRVDPRALSPVLGETLEIVAACNPQAPEFVPLPPTALHELLTEVRGCRFALEALHARHACSPDSSPPSVGVAASAPAMAVDTVVSPAETRLEQQLERLLRSRLAPLLALSEGAPTGGDYVWASLESFACEPPVQRGGE